MPTNSAVREMLPPKRLIWARRYSRSNASRASRNNVERLMILAGGDAEAEVGADMLPQDVGSMVPTMPRGDGGEHLMGLPLREAREAFEREYLRAQISRFGGNISRTAEFVGMERSALHRKLKALGMD